jgi:hypothetical protein
MRPVCPKNQGDLANLPEAETVSTFEVERYLASVDREY